MAEPISPAPHVVIVEAPYYKHITDPMLAGATAALEAEGMTWERVEVAGAFEIPQAIALLHRACEAHPGRRRIDGYIALGCVLRGETSHYDLICNETARALMDLSLRHGLALGFGVLTCENEQQALVRAAPDKKNKGGEAARACIMTLQLKASLRLYPG